MADPVLHPETLIHQTLLLKEIAVDYCPEVCSHTPESNEIVVIFDERGGARWRSKTRFQYGTFGARIKCPKGNTSGLNFNIYLSSLEGDKSQDEIDFEFLGKDKTIIQTNVYTTGTGNREQIHELGFDCSDGFHDYEIKWSRDLIEWLIDGKIVRRDEREEGVGFPEKPMFLYASVWDASYIDEGRWTGNYVGCDAPYTCMYKDVRVPLTTAVVNSEDLIHLHETFYELILSNSPKLEMGSDNVNYHYRHLKADTRTICRNKSKGVDFRNQSPFVTCSLISKLKNELHGFINQLLPLNAPGGKS